MKIFIAHPNSIDYKTKIYEPIRASTLGTEHEFFLPHEHEIFEITKDLIRECDVLVVDVSAPALGPGIELGWADAFGVRTIAMHEKGTRLSNSVKNVVPTIFEYENPADMLTKLENALSKP